MLITLKKLFYIFDYSTRIQILIIFGLMIFSAVLETVGIGLIVPFIALMTDPDIIERNIWLFKTKQLMNIKDPMDFLILMSVFLMFFYIIKNVILGFLNYIQLRFILSKRSLLGRDLLRSYLYQPYTFYLQRNTAELIRNMNYDVANVYNFVQGLLKVASESCVMICIIVMLIFVNPLIVICSISVLGLVSGIFYKSISNYSNRLGKQVQVTQMGAGKAVLEGFGSIKEIKISWKEEFFPRKYYLAMMENARANWKYSTINAMPRLFLEVIAVGTVVMIIVLSKMQGHDLKLLLPTLGLFAMATVRLMPSLSQIVANLQLIRFNTASVNTVYDDIKLIKKKQPAKLNSSSNSKIIFKKIIKIQNVTYSYSNSHNNSLDNISFEIFKGQAIALAGPSGAGKTTLANLILGLLTPTSGDIFVDEQNICDNLAGWQKNIGFVPQTIYLLDSSIKNNIAFGLEENEIDEHKVRKALEIAQLVQFINDLPNGINTIIGENGVRLSGGQRQRLGIARALYHEPDILVFDEATSSLDADTERDVTKAIEQLSGVKTLIIIAHRLSTIKNCSKILYMENGSVKASGTFRELFSENEVFKS